MISSFEGLSKKRREWVEISRENGFEDGIKQLLSDLYPDNAHFIYELLQNAEDAQAQEVRFILRGDHIEFEHDGKKLFSIEDVEAITSIGDSPKRDDATSIGKFGVGFKAVFAYTSTPRITSGDFSFQIRDMVVPERVNSHKQTSDDGKTRFLLPFDNPHKSLSQAENEIKTLLQALDATTLLFLTNIRKIEYLLPDASLGYIERIDHRNNRFEIRVLQPNKTVPTSAWFLAFEKKVQIADEETGIKKRERKKCRIAVAFEIMPIEENRPPNKGKRGNKDKWKITPMEPGRVCIYFPAVKETSNLRFHIHAPFASTVARDNVRDCAGNNSLRDCLAELLAESMHKIRDQGLLSVQCLAILPNDKDNLPEFYKPFLDRLIKEFREQDLVPMKHGEHAAASGIFQGQRTLSDLIDDNDLVTLLGDDYIYPMWVANPPQRNQREDQFLSGLNISEWTFDDLVSALKDFKEEDRAQWMREKDDAWHQQLYVCLEPHATKLQHVKIIKTSDGTYKKGGECYFPTDETLNDEQFPRVAKGTYCSGKAENKNALDFLRSVGVRDVDEEVEIESILRAHYTEDMSFPNAVEHYRHLKRFIGFLDLNPSKNDLFKSYLIFKIDGKGGASNWKTPVNIYLDTPFKETGLREYYEPLEKERKKNPLSNEYNNSGIKPERIGKFAEQIGASTLLPIECISVSSSHPDWPWLDKYGGSKYTKGSKNVDYHIPNLENFFEQPSIGKSALLWLTMQKLCEDYIWEYYYAKAEFGRNEKNIRCVKSTLAHNLKTIKWVPQKNDGTFEYVAPCDAIAEKLPEGFEYQTGWLWVSGVGFGKRIREEEEAQRQALERQTSEYKRKEDVLREVGFESPEEAIELAKLKRDDPEGFRKWKDSQRKEAEFPSRPVSDSERRQERLKEQLEKSPEKNFESRERSVRTSAIDGETATWLRNQYTKPDGEMFCQICKKVLPFRKRDGEYYFEKKEILSRDHLPKENVAQHIALCPLHAAMYEEFIKNDEAAMLKLKETIAQVEGVEVPIFLNNEETSIRFVESHIHDLKTIINELAGDGGNDNIS